MKTEELTEGTILIAKDGSEYVEFKYYMDDKHGRRKARSQVPTSIFMSSRGRAFLSLENYRIPTDCEMELIKRCEEFEKLKFDVVGERCKVTETANQIDSVPIADCIFELQRKIKSLADEISCVVNLTAKDYIKGEYMLGKLNDMTGAIDNIKALLNQQKVACEDIQEIAQRNRCIYIGKY